MKQEIGQEDLKLRNLREVYVTKEQYIQCLKSSDNIAQNLHTSTSFKPRDFKTLRGSNPLGMGGATAASLFADESSKRSVEIPELVHV